MTSNCKWFSIPARALDQIYEQSLSNIIAEASLALSKKPIKLKMIRERNQNGLFDSKYYYYGKAHPVLEGQFSAKECGEPCLEAENSKFYTASVKSISPGPLNSICFDLLKDCRCQLQSYTLVITPTDRKRHHSKSTLSDENGFIKYSCGSDFKLQVEVQITDPNSELLTPEAKALTVRAKGAGVELTNAVRPNLLGRLLGQANHNNFTIHDDMNFLEIVKQSVPYLVANGRNEHSGRVGDSVGFYLKDEFNEKVTFDPFATQGNSNVCFVGSELESFRFIDAMVSKYSSSCTECDYAYTLYGHPQNYPLVIGLNNAQLIEVTKSVSHNFDIIELVSSFIGNFDRSKENYIEECFLDLVIGYLLELVEEKLTFKTSRIVAYHLKSLFADAMSSEVLVTTKKLISLCRLSIVQELNEFANEIEVALLPINRLLDTCKPQELTPSKMNFFVDSSRLLQGGDEDSHIQSYVRIFSLLMNSSICTFSKKAETARLTHRYVCLPVAEGNGSTQLTERFLRQCRMAAISCLSVYKDTSHAAQKIQALIEGNSTIRVKFEGVESNSMIVRSGGVSNKLYFHGLQ